MRFKVIPYNEKQMSIELNEKKTGPLLKKVNMSYAITKFRSRYPKDPGSVSVFSIQCNKPVMQVIIGGVTSILMMEMILSTIRKK